MDVTSLITVVYTAEPDEIFEFHSENQARLFGRDDARCDIVVWSAINSDELSRVAGRLWRMDDELWVRNLSTRHELRLRVPGEAGIETLPIRHEDGVDRGPARSIPAPLAYVDGPAGCELQISQTRAAAIDVVWDDDGAQPATVRLPPLDDALRPVAVALCRPILDGGVLPAPYREIMRELGIDSQKRVRNIVADLLKVYETAAPELRRRAAADELRRLDVPSEPMIGRDGVRRFDHVPAAETGRKGGEHGLPDSYEVAHLLVRHRLVTLAETA